MSRDNIVKHDGSVDWSYIGNNLTTSIIINVKNYGTVGNGANDDTAAIQSAINFVESRGGGTLYFPKGSYLIKSLLYLATNVRLLGDIGAEILVDDSFVFQTGIDTDNFIKTKGHNEKFSASSRTKNITLQNMRFRANRTSITERDFISIANTENFIIDTCDFIFENHCRVIALDIRAAYKGVTVRNCRFIQNYTTVDHVSGFIWVRNSGGFNLIDGANSDNFASDVNISKCYFEKATGDEHIAVWGWYSTVHNIRIDSCTFVQDDATAITNAYIISAYTDGANTTANLSNILITNNIFDIKRIYTAAIGINAGTYINQIYNIITDNNIINLKTSDITGSPGFILCKNASGVISKNQCINVGVTKLTYGIHETPSSTSVVDNYLDGGIGGITNGFAYCDTVRDNFVTNVNKGASYCKNVIGNTFTGITTTGVEFGASNVTATVFNNNITLSNVAGIYAIQLLNFASATISAYVKGNMITTTVSSQKAFYGECTSGSYILEGNIKYGSGAFIWVWNGCKVERMSNNKVDDTNYDTLYAGRPSVNDLENAIPIGHMAWNTTAVAPSIGWKKIAAGYGSDKWLEIKTS